MFERCGVCSIMSEEHDLLGPSAYKSLKKKIKYFSKDVNELQEWKKNFELKHDLYIGKVLALETSKKIDLDYIMRVNQLEKNDKTHQALHDKAFKEIAELGDKLQKCGVKWDFRLDELGGFITELRNRIQGYSVSDLNHYEVNKGQIMELKEQIELDIDLRLQQVENWMATEIPVKKVLRGFFNKVREGVTYNNQEELIEEACVYALAKLDGARSARPTVNYFCPICYNSITKVEHVVFHEFKVIVARENLNWLFDHLQKNSPKLKWNELIEKYLPEGN